MQCKDIPERPILEFLHKLAPRWACWFSGFDNSVLNAMPKDTDPKLGLAKMRSMMNKGLVDGCSCGCRGDFVITDKGEEALVFGVHK